MYTKLCMIFFHTTNFTGTDFAGLHHGQLAKIWQFYGQNMVLIWSFILVLAESVRPGMLHVKLHIAGCIL